MISIQQRLAEMNVYVFDTVDRPTGGRWHIVNCPLCGDTEKKGAVQAEEGNFRCMHEARCGVSISWYEFQKQLGFEPQKKTNNPGQYFKPKPKTYKMPEVHAEYPSGTVLQYLINRCLDTDAIKQYKIGMKDGNIVFPYFKDGGLVGVKYRTTTEKKFWKEKGARPVLFGMDNITGSTLCITEGEFDAIAGASYGVQAVSVPDGASSLEWIAEEYDRLERFSKIYFILDNDEAGQKNVETIANRLGRWRCKNVILPEKDLNSCLMKQVTAETIHECIENATDFGFKILRSAGDFIEELIAYNSDEEARYGTPTPFADLDRIVKGWRPEELTIIQGNTGHGKTTLVAQIIADLLKRKQSVAVASLEAGALKFLNLLIIQSNIYGSTEPDIIRSEIERYEDRLQIIDYKENIDIRELLDIYEYSHRRYGTKFFVLDNLMMAKVNSADQNVEDKRVMTAILSFTKKFNVHFFLVVHPRKPSSDSYVPDVVDISGTANIGNLASNILVVHKIGNETKKKKQKQNEDRGENKPIADGGISVKKNREWGILADVPLTYNPLNRTLKEMGLKL